MTSEKKKKPKLLSPQTGTRIKMEDERPGPTHKFTIIGGDKSIEIGKDGKAIEVQRDLDGYLTANRYKNGELGEVFLKIGKQGGVWKVYDAFMIAISIGLQYGIPLKVFIDKFEHMEFEPKGPTNNPDIPISKSIPDYIFRWLKRFLPKEIEDRDGTTRCIELDKQGG